MTSTVQEKPKKKSVATSTRARKVATSAIRLPSHEDVAKRAHELYVSSDYQGGREVEFWLEAERQLRNSLKA